MNKFNLSPEKNFQKDTILSVKAFGKKINRSEETGKRFKKELIRLKLISSKTNIKLFSSDRVSRREFFFMELPRNYFVTKAGYVYKSEPCIIDVRLSK